MCKEKKKSQTLEKNLGIKNSLVKLLEAIKGAKHFCRKTRRKRTRSTYVNIGPCCWTSAPILVSVCRTLCWETASLPVRRICSQIPLRGDYGRNVACGKRSEKHVLFGSVSQCDPNGDWSKSVGAQKLKMADLPLFNEEDGCSIRSTFQGIKIKEFILIFVVVVVITFYSPPPPHAL